MEVKVEKNGQKKSKRSIAKKMLIVVQCWLNQGQAPDEKTQPILWTEWPTGTLVSTGSLSS
jgi:hypothetical protein